MKKLKLDDLSVSSFEVEGPLTAPEEYRAITNPTPDTHCFVCGYTDGSCEALCLPGAGGSGA